MMKDLWIKNGYEAFALNGDKSLKVEVLAKQLGISKSSFYHHFSEMDVFIECLLNHHLKQSEIIAEKERKANHINPDLIDILVEHKIDLLFNRQLRINQQVDWYKNTLQQSTLVIGNAFVQLWMKDLNLTQRQVEALFELALENFFLQINQHHLNHQWLLQYFDNLKKIAKTFEP